MTTLKTKTRLVKTPPGLANYPLIDDIHTIIPMPLITYAEPELGCEFKLNACRLTRDVTREAPAFKSYPLCFTLPDTPDSFDVFVAAMRLTVNWLAHKKGSTGRQKTIGHTNTSQSVNNPVGPTKFHDYSWTYHCPSFGHRQATLGTKSNPIPVPSHLTSTITSRSTQLLQHLIDNPEDESV